MRWRTGDGQPVLARRLVDGADGSLRAVDLPHRPAPASIHLVSSDESDAWQSIGSLTRLVVTGIEVRDAV
jgi:hypothetical protein